MAFDVSHRNFLGIAGFGIAMGISGTSVAKKSASLIFLEDELSTNIRAMREGRRLYDTLCKVLRQALAANVADVSAIPSALLLIGDDPLLTLAPLMNLWIILASEGLPALALGCGGKRRAGAESRSSPTA